MKGFITDEREGFEVSARDFRERARAFGWPFWRGVIVGFVASFPIAYTAMVGDLIGP